MNNYILDGKTPVLEPDITKWAKWYEAADRTVAYTVVDTHEVVSTVFLGSDHQWGIGPPLLFETMVFGGNDDGFMSRYSTWQEAEQGHEAIVNRLVPKSEPN